MSTTTKIKGFKGFNSDFTCLGFQYKAGETYKTDKVKICKHGFHFCEKPEDVLYYYGFNGKFAIVNGNGEIARKDDKVAVSEIKIVKELSLHEFVKEIAKSIMENTLNKKTNTGDRSAATNTGDRSAATNTGDRSVATNTGEQSAATNTGDFSEAKVSGKDSVAIATGYKSRVSGKIGCGLVIVERDDNDNYKIIHIKAVIVDGVKIKEDTFYTLKNGKIVECNK